MGRHSFFHRQLAQYILHFFIIFLLIILACCPFIWHTYRYSTGNAFRQVEVRLQEGVGNLCSTVENLDTSGRILNQDSNIRTLSSVNGELPDEYYMLLPSVKELVLSLYTSNNNLEHCFMLFPNNNIFISNLQVSASLEEVYGVFLESSGRSAQEFRDLFFRNEQRTSFIPMDNLLYYSYSLGKNTTQSHPLVCLNQITSQQGGRQIRFVMVSVFDPAQLAEWMLPENIRGCSYLVIHDTEGQELFSFGDAAYADAGKSGVRRTSAVNTDYGITASVFYPQDAFGSTIADSLKILLLYSVFGLLAAVAMILYFSFRQYAPLKKLTAAAALDTPEIPDSGDEYDFISRALSSAVTSKKEYQEKLNEMESALQLGTVEKLMIRGIETADEQEQLERFLKVPIVSFCVSSVLIRNSSEEYSAAALAMQEFLHQNLSIPFICIPSSYQEFLILVLMDSNPALTLQDIRDSFGQMASHLTASCGCITNIGFSMVQQDIRSLNLCYNQAMQARRVYAMEQKNTLEIFDPRPSQLLTSYLNVEELQKYKNYLLSGDRDMVETQLKALLECAGSDLASIQLQQQQIYYLLGHMISCAAEELSMAEGDTALLPSYCSSWSYEEMLAVLKSSCFRLCDRINDSKRNKNSRLKEDIINYLSTSYTRCDLTALIASQQLGISEKYLLKFVREQTGKTFNTYLEQLRLKKAQELILDGSYSNSQIAELSGFGSDSTLYRAFNKYVGMPPAAYRKMMQDQTK